jgi:hypothetical protein
MKKKYLIVTSVVVVLIILSLLMFFYSTSFQAGPNPPPGQIYSSFCKSRGGEIVSYQFGNETSHKCPNGKQFLGDIYDLNCPCMCCV